MTFPMTPAVSYAMMDALGQPGPSAVAAPTEKKKILIVDDNVRGAELISQALVEAGFATRLARSGAAGLRQFFNFRPDLVILDVVMADVNGLEVCRQIRQMADVPIILATSLDGEEDIVRGLNCGAIDYIVKPFSLSVLTARVQAALRQIRPASSDQLLTGYQDNYLAIDLVQRRIMCDGEEVALTRTEYRLLAYLLRHNNRVLTYDQIMEHVWGWAEQGSVANVHVLISRLRRKIERAPKDPRYLLLEYGVGYRFQTQASSE